MEMNYMKEDHEDNPADVYSVIKSPEVRGFLRDEAKLNIFKEAAIILHSYIPIQQKLAMLKQLYVSGNKKEAKLISEVYGILTGYMNQIYHPAVRTIFLLENMWPYLEGTDFREDSDFVDAYDTVDEVIEVMEAYSRDGMGKHIYGLVTVVQVPQDEKLRGPFAFTLFWIDGKWQIKDIDTYEEKSLKTQGVDRHTLSLLKGWGNCRYPLPFEDGSRLKLQTPFMEEPFYGILSSVNADGWYHNLYDENDPEREQLISLSYADMCSRYSSLDWIERA